MAEQHCGPAASSFSSENRAFSSSSARGNTRSSQGERGGCEEDTNIRKINKMTYRSIMMQWFSNLFVCFKDPQIDIYIYLAADPAV